jgi:hypothetical protein
MFMLLREKFIQGSSLGMDLCGTAILPLQPAAKEAWMSITPRHRIAALLRFGMNLKSFVWAARSERGR